MPENLWNSQSAQENPALDGLVYRSNLLARDRSIVNIYGGNTSAKLTEIDHLGRPVEVLWVKGSGSDLASITGRGFAGLRQAEVLPLMSREAMSDEEMVAYLSHCTHAPDRPRQSIETLLHAFTSAKHVDHTHPDAVISLACSEQGRELCRRLWGQRALWVDYIRPGFTLSKWIGEGLLAQPAAELVIMGKHGLLTWGDTSQACYASSIRAIQEAEDFIQLCQKHSSRGEGRKIFAASAVPPMPDAQRQELLAQVLPVLRGVVSQQRPAILQYDGSPAVLDFVGSAGAQELSQVGAACPDHLVHTKRQPLFVDWHPAEGGETLSAKLLAGVQTFAAGYSEYFQRCSQACDRMGDPYPRVILIPGLGMVTTGTDVQAAAVAGQLYHRAISVMAGSQVLDRFTSLTPEESYQIEYWPLELYKLSLKPAPRELAGRVAVVTGGASGIGRATAFRLAQDGAHVVILDLHQENAQVVAGELNSRFGAGRGMAVACDVTDEAAVARAFEQAVLAYGGMDMVVSSAGIAISAPIEQTSLADWNFTLDVLAKGYFLVSREAFRLWKRQKMGGSLIFVASKNSVAAGKNAAAYGAAKAAELHLARCLAEEGGAYGIRVNSVLPDAVLQGSSIWNSSWRQARAAGYGIKPEELEEYYRQRTTLKVNVHPEHVAEAISFLAGPRSSRTTGGAITVDGGVATAYVR